MKNDAQEIIVRINSVWNGMSLVSILLTALRETPYKLVESPGRRLSLARFWPLDNVRKGRGPMPVKPWVEYQIELLLHR
jgi:hypothetical protein